MTEDVVALFIPIVLFIVIAVVLVLRYYFSFRGQRELQTTVRTAVEQGNPLSPELIDRLTPLPPRDADLRRGFIAITVALATGAFALLLDEPDAHGPLLGLACFPLFVGLGYLLLWYIGRRQDPGA